MIPAKWGHGQLFAFSALDGESYFTDDFTGILSGDKIGVTFQTQCRRTLFFSNINKTHPEFQCVASDIIIAEALKDNLSIIFTERHLVTGEYSDISGVFVCTDGECEITRQGDIEIHDTKDGEFTALLKRNGKYSFAFGKSANEVAVLCERGISTDIELLKSHKLKPFENKLPEDNKYSALYAKCISVMKSQLYSPEGNIKRLWSTPDRLPHRNMWLWDSVFHAIGHRNIDADIAKELIIALFDIQEENGFIPHMANPDLISHITQPPVIGWGAYLVYEKSGDKEFLKEVFRNNKRFLLWCKENRRKGKKELYSWHTNPELNNRCDESGMDNSPRFDTDSDLLAIDFSCFMANETRYMKKIAEELGDTENVEFFDAWYKKIKEDINSTLWCDKDEFYYDYDINNDCFNKVSSVVSFLPLFSGVCDEKKATSLLVHLENPDEFGTAFPVPSISKKDKTFGTDMWRGPVWINFNYIIAKGLAEYGYDKASQEIIDKTLETINTWYKRTGTVFEFYDCENLIPPSCFNRKGKVFEPYDFRVKYQSIRDYGWSITLTFDLLNQLYNPKE